MEEEEALSQSLGVNARRDARTPFVQGTWEKRKAVAWPGGPQPGVAKCRSPGKLPRDSA